MMEENAPGNGPVNMTGDMARHGTETGHWHSIKL